RGSLCQIHDSAEEGYTAVGAGDDRYPDDAGTERAVGNSRYQNRVENKVRIHELAGSAASRKVVRVAIECVEFAKEDANVLGKKLGIVQVGDRNRNVLVECRGEGEQGFGIGGDKRTNKAIDGAAITCFSPKTDQGSSQQPHPHQIQIEGVIQ